MLPVITAFLSIGRSHTKAAAAPATAPAAAGMAAAAAEAWDKQAEEEMEYEIEDTITFSPRKACEYVYDQVRSTVANPKLVFGVTFDDGQSVPVLDCDVQLRSVSVLKVSVWYVGGGCFMDAGGSARKRSIGRSNNKKANHLAHALPTTGPAGSPPTWAAASTRPPPRPCRPSSPPWRPLPPPPRSSTA